MSGWRGAAAAFVGFGVVGKVLAFAATLFIASRVSDDDFGLYALFTVSIGLLGTLIGLGLPEAAGRVGLDDREAVRWSPPSLLGGQLVFSLALLVAGSIIFWTGALGSGPLSALGPAVLLAALAVAFTRTVDAHLTSRRKTAPAGLLTMLVAALPAVAFAFAVTYTTRSLADLVWLYAGCLLAVAIVALVYVRRDFMPLHISAKELGAALFFGAPLIPHQLSHWVIGSCDRFMIEHYIDLGSVGVYHVIYIAGAAVMLVGSALNRAWWPRVLAIASAESAKTVAEALENPDARRRAQALTTSYLLVLSVLCGGAFLAGPSLAWVIEAEYEPGLALLPPVLAGMSLAVLYVIPMTTMFYDQRTRLIPALTTLAAVVNLALNALWLPRLGLAGAAWATFVGYGVLLAGFSLAARTATARLVTPAALAKFVVIVAGCAAMNQFIGFDLGGVGIRAVTVLGLLTLLATNLRGNA